MIERTLEISTIGRNPLIIRVLILDITDAFLPADKLVMMKEKHCRLVYFRTTNMEKNFASESWISNQLFDYLGVDESISYLLDGFLQQYKRYSSEKNDSSSK